MHTATLSRWLIGASVIAAFTAAFAAIYLIMRPNETMLSQSSDISPSTRPEVTADSPCKGRLDGPIAYKRLSDEKAVPFVQFGKPVPVDDPYYQQYQVSIGRFPDVRSCLVESQKRQGAPDLTLFDWAAFRSLQDADVCLFRVFSSIGSIHGAKQWLGSQGFTLGLTQNISSSVMKTYGDEASAAGTGVDATWSVVKCGDKFHPSLSKMGAYALSVGVVFKGNGDVASAGVTYITL